MEWLGTLLRCAQLVGSLVLLGSLSLLLLAGPARSPDAARWRSSLLALAPWLTGLTLVAGVALLMWQVASVSGRGAASLQWSEWARLLDQTRYGAVWQWRQLAAALLLLLLLTRRHLDVRLGERSTDALLLLLAAAMNAASAFTGHPAATEPVWLAIGSHLMHVFAAGTWAGALPALAYGLVLAAKDRHGRFRPTFVIVIGRFSVLAGVSVALLVASGSVVAWLQFGMPQRWPARRDDILGGMTTLLERGVAPLLGTSFGLLVLAKICLLALVLVVAARVRWVWMPRMRQVPPAQDAGWRSAAGLVWLEAGVALLIVFLAASLTGTLPAAHDQVVWPLKLRWSLAATWDLPGVAMTASVAALSALLGMVVLAHDAAQRQAMESLGAARRRVRVAAAGCLVVVGGWLGLSALSVDAYPDTFRRTETSYNAVSISRGTDLYLRHCVACHGAGGKGDGPQAAGLPRRPANLTEPHTALHTAGDIFWWLTHGKPEGGMPGFAQELSIEDRWDVVNFLRAFSSGHQARILTPSVVPNQPWLAAPDFDFSTRAGESGSLQQYRERNAVLLVFATLPGSTGRLEQLSRIYPTLQARSIEILLVLEPASTAPPSEGLPFPVVDDGAWEAATAYRLFQRTLANPGKTVLGDPPVHMEMLIDRFGYARARWSAQDSTDASAGDWRGLPFLLRQVDQLSREPMIRPPPEAHVH